MCNALPDPRQCWILKERCLEYKCSNCTMFSLSFTYHASLVSRNRICHPFALPLFRLECFCHFSILLSLHQETVCQILCPITGMGKLQLQTGSRSPFSPLGDRYGRKTAAPFIQKSEPIVLYSTSVSLARNSRNRAAQDSNSSLVAVK